MANYIVYEEKATDSTIPAALEKIIADNGINNGTLEYVAFKEGSNAVRVVAMHIPGTAIVGTLEVINKAPDAVGDESDTIGIYIYDSVGAAWERWLSDGAGAAKVEFQNTPLAYDSSLLAWIYRKYALADVLNGSIACVTGTAQPFAGVETLVWDEVTIMAPGPTPALPSGGNVAVAYIGNSGVSAANGSPINPGESFSVKVKDLAKLYVLGTTGDDIRYIVG